jgi:hypothetical protein
MKGLITAIERMLAHLEAILCLLVRMANIMKNQKLDKKKKGGGEISTLKKFYDTVNINEHLTMKN